jgi:aspartyl/asparaginyl beta-hydroxylase (cupin superfamily)
MNARSAGAGDAADEQKVVSLMAGVERLVGERRDAEAQRLLGEAAAILPAHPLVLHEQARRVALNGDSRAARTLLERVVASAPNHVPFWLSLAAVLRNLGKRDEEARALERALALEPRHLVALLQKAALLDLMDKPRAAAAVYGNALKTLAPSARLPAPLEAHVAHARQRVAENASQIAMLLEQRLDPHRRAHGAGPSLRFERCMDRVLGRRRVFVPEPTGVLFPFLTNHEFHPREDFGWLSTLESHTESIREELLGVLHEDQAGIEPYITYPEGLPLDQWRELNHSRRWSAYFLWNEGVPQAAHRARCPRTVQALSALPQLDVPGRGPTAFFSLLEPRTRIPPHTGITNVRLTVHLPLIVPPGCRFRVGGEIREWHAGQAWVFDDTIEHEAWNDSEAPRAILIFDVWNPQLSAQERDLVREALVVLAEYNAAEGVAAGSGS